jgi:hypothetical protein
MMYNYTTKTTTKNAFFTTLYNKVIVTRISRVNPRRGSSWIFFFLFFGEVLFPARGFSQSLLEDHYNKHQHIQPKSGVLLSSFGMLVDVEGMNGEPGADTIDFERGQEAFRLGLLQRFGLKNYDAMREKFVARQQQHIANGVVPIGLVDMQYTDVNPALARESRIHLDDDSNYRFQLVGYKETVYQDKYMFSVVLPVASVRSEVQFAVLDSQLVLSSFSDWKQLKWKWVMNGTTINLQWNVPFMIPRKGDGGEVLGFLMAEVDNQNPRVQFLESPYLNNGTNVITFGSYFRIVFNFKNGSAPDLLAQNDLSIHYYVDPMKASMKAMYSVHLGYGDFGKVRTCVEKPLVIVEGVDYGYPGYPAGFKDQKYGENGYIDLLKGENWDVPSQIWKSWESIKEAPGAIEKLRKAGFDIIYVDFYDGGQDMNHNAEVLIEVIKRIQERMCGREMHVLGVSMGGVVAKRALRLMENRGINHCVISLTSFDSPHQGANLPLGLQNTIKYFKGSIGVCDDLFHRIIRRTATQQLLVNHEISSYRAAPARSLWLREDTLFGGYPSKPWLFAISNGSSEGVKANMKYSSTEALQAGMTMMRLQLRTMLLFGWVKNYVADIYAENFYDRKAKKYYNGRLNFLATFHSHKDNLLWDHVPGSMVKQFQLFEELGKSYFLKTPFLTDESCFIPTVSSLDVVSGGFDANSIVTKDFKLLGGTMGQILSNDMRTPFQRVFIPKNNQPHVKLDSGKGGNVDWLIDQLLSVSGVEDPHTITEGYNLRSPHLRNLKGLTVYKSGLFELNGVGDYPKETAADSVLGSSAEERIFYAGDCAGAHFSVRDSGLFIVGKHLQRTRFVLGGKSQFEVSKWGELRVVRGGNTVVLASGSELWLKDDAQLRIEDGAQFIVESGAVLRLSDRAKLFLEGSGALLHIKGKLVLDSGVYFRPIPGLDGKVGLVKFSCFGHGYGDAEIEAYGARMAFEGNSTGGSRTLQIEGRMKFPEAGLGKPLSRFEITRSVVCFAPSSVVLLSGRVSVTDSRIERAEWASGYCGGFRYKGSEGIFRDLHFRFQDTALFYESTHTSGKPLFTGNYFIDCNRGVHIASGSIRIQKSFFEKNGCGVAIQNIWNEAVIESSKFYENKVAVQIENESETFGKLLALNNEFYENGLGMDVKKVEVFLNCQRFAGNEQGIVADESRVKMDASQVIESELLDRKFVPGVNVFSDHGVHAIEMKRAELWADGYNYFHHTRSKYKGQAFIEGNFRLVKTASYYKEADQTVALGSNRFFPSHAQFTIDSVNKQYVLLKHQGSDVTVSGYLMTAFEGATCVVDKDSKDVLQMKYAILEEAEDVKGMVSVWTPKRCFGIDGAIKYSESANETWIYGVQGKLVGHATGLKAQEEIKMSAGIYLVRTDFGGVIQTDKVMVNP